MSRIHDQSPQAKTAKPPADMTGDVASPQNSHRDAEGDKERGVRRLGAVSG